MSTCPECNKDFEPLGDWQVICKQCFAIAKAKEDKESETAPDLSHAINRLASAIESLAKAAE